MITSSELAARAGISRQHLNRLVREGLVEPSGERSRKAGSRAVWLEDDVAVVARMVAARHHLAHLGRCPVPTVRLRSLGAGLLAIGGEDGVVVKVTAQTTVAQLLRILGGAFAVIPKE